MKAWPPRKEDLIPTSIIRAEWEKEFPWIEPNKLGRVHFSCKICERNLLCGITAVRKHERTFKYASKSAALKPSLVSIMAVSVSTSS